MNGICVLEKSTLLMSKPVTTYQLRAQMEKICKFYKFSSYTLVSLQIV